MTDAWDPVAAFTRGDSTRSALLRRNLEHMRDNSEDKHIQRIVSEVLDGRRSVRELVRDERFEEELNRGMASFAEQWEALTPEERAELVRAGQEQENARREAEGLAPLAEPPAQVGDSPLLRRD
ncbi:MAG: hypothetical protein ABIR39_21760 [Nocardioides sp.]|uniref:hypothetical protein n=1 Tax=Nocardioides sp. TaxID=35761 RepID=UPI003264ED88